MRDTSQQTVSRVDDHAVLRDLPLLMFMPPDARRLVEESFVPVGFPFGATIVREGDPADAFYVLVSGAARALKRGDHGEEVALNVLKPGDGFGEIALLEGGSRTATVRASAQVQALRLDRSVFRALVRSRPEIGEFLDLHVRSHHLRDFLRLNSAFSELPPDALVLMLRALETVEVDAGQVVIREGDPPGPMYIVQDGRLRAYVGPEGNSGSLSYLRKGDFFGELSVLKSAPRSAYVEALCDCTLLALPPEALRALLDEHPSFRECVERRIAQYDYRRVANVPLDFADEILPADAGASAPVSPDQVDDATEPRATEGPEESWDEAQFGRPEKRIRRFPHLFQIDEMDCGAACLGIVSRHFGRKVSLAHIRDVAHTSTDGTSLAGLARGADALGLAAQTVKASKSRLDELPLPAVVHWEGNHWVVVYDTGPKHVRVSDPARGHRRVPRGEFQANWSGYAVVFAYTDAFEQAPESQPSFRWLGRFLRPYRGTLVRAFLLALLAAAVQMLIPVFSQVIVDSVVVDGDRGLLTLIVIGMVGVLVVSIGATVAQRYILSRTAVKIDGETLDFLSRRLLELPMSYFTTRRTGDIERRLAGMRQVRLFVVQSGVQGLTAATQILVAIILMFVYSWTLALVYLATVPLYAGLMRFSAKRLQPVFATLEEAFAKYHSRQIDAIKGIETVKVMGAEPGLRRMMGRDFHDLSQKVFRSDFTVMIYEGAVQMVTFLSLALFLWVGALHVLSGDISVGEFVSFNALVLLANGPIGIVLLLWDQLQQSSVLLSRMNDILEQEPEQGEDRSHLAQVRTLEGRVRLQNVGFTYGGAVAVPVLEGVTFDVEPGATVAIVGRSGSGKTTLVKCLAGLFEPTQGRVLVDGADLRTLDYRSLRRHIGFVLQENHLFDDTIARNIAFGDDEPDMERVLWAARVANAHDFVTRLPLGYETKVGDSGLLVSGGQRQRIAIARAVYNRPPILILDEATSALDTESERAVKENMDRLLEARTSFIIAHRLSTVRDADVILVLERGRLVEHGSHDDLMRRRGLYFYLVSQQLDL